MLFRLRFFFFAWYILCFSHSDGCALYSYLNIFCLQIFPTLQGSKLGLKSLPPKVHYPVHQRLSLGPLVNSVGTFTPCLSCSRPTSPTALSNCYNTIYANFSTPTLSCFFPRRFSDYNSVSISPCLRICCTSHQSRYP